MIHNTQSPQISQKPDGHNIYAIMRTMCPPGYHHVYTSCFQVHELPQSHYADDWYIVYFFLPLEPITKTKIGEGHSQGKSKLQGSSIDRICLDV